MKQEVVCMAIAPQPNKLVVLTAGEQFSKENEPKIEGKIEKTRMSYDKGNLYRNGVRVQQEVEPEKVKRYITKTRQDEGMTH